jgi:1-acyl-sn-glycerol-3-phosphate acyltransferase
MAQIDLWYKLATTVLRGYVTLFMESIHVQGYTNIPPGPKIIVANHPNASDPFVLPIIFREKLYCLIQEDLFKVPIVGPILAMAGQIPVKTGQGRLALRMAQEKLMAGKSVVIFPEGHLNHGEELRRAGVGAAVLALETGAPILPLGFYVPPDSTRTFIRHMFDRTTVGRWQWGGKMYLTIGEPWLPAMRENLDRQYRSVREVTDGMMNRVGQMVAQARLMAGMTTDSGRLTEDDSRRIMLES